MNLFAFIKNFVRIGIVLFGTAVPLIAGGTGEEAGTAEQPVISAGDSKGVESTIRMPVRRIVSINSGLSEIVAALGAADRCVGRDVYSTFPSELRKVYTVATSSSSPNMEKIFQLEPDLVLADAMFNESHRRMLNNRGIPVLIEKTSDPDYLPELVRKLGYILGEEARADEIISIIENSIAGVSSEVARARDSGTAEPVVFFENRKVNKSASKLSGHHRFIELAGGDNIAKDEPVTSPALSPEYIVERNPDVIIRRISGDAGSDALEKMVESIYSRPSLASVSAVLNGNIHIIKSDFFVSLRYPAGVAYFAEWFYPDALSSFDAERVHEELITSLYGEDEWTKVREVYVYP